MYRFVKVLKSYVTVWKSCESFKELASYNVESIVKNDTPNSDTNDTRVSCMCSVLDVLWIGTGSGHIFIFEVKADDNYFTLLSTLKPYDLETRNLCLAKLNDEYVVLSCGKTVNQSLFGESSLCCLEDIINPPDGSVYLTRMSSSIPINSQHDRNHSGKSTPHTSIPPKRFAKSPSIASSSSSLPPPCGEDVYRHRKVILTWKVLSAKSIKTMTTEKYKPVGKLPL